MRAVKRLYTTTLHDKAEVGQRDISVMLSEIGARKAGRPENEVDHGLDGPSNDGRGRGRGG